jgi:endoglucanase
VRAAGAKNIIVAGGISYALDLRGILEGHALKDPGGNGIVYATHFYNWHGNWASNFLAVAERYPVLVGEFGADIKKMSFVPKNKQEDPMTWVPDALAMMQKYKLNWTAFSLHPKATPVLIRNWDYEPTPFYGVFVKDALAGKTFELQRMR